MKIRGLHWKPVVILAGLCLGLGHQGEVRAQATVLSAGRGEGTRAGAEQVMAGVTLRWCPPGKFTMGSPPGEPGRRADEAQVEVTLTRGFWLGQFEVTQRQWRRFRPLAREADVAGRGDEFPVYWVSYLDAEEFCRWLTRQARAAGELPAGWEFALPTEAQWEYACRAGTTTAFAFGAELTPRHANFGRPYRGEPRGYPKGSAEPVGRYPANAWGLHDMHGNEFEWCRDWYHARLPGGTDPDLSDRQGEPNRDGSFSRVRRGGAWTDSSEFCRSALRLRYEPDRSSDHIGFRVALVQAAARRAE
ncbi:MAG: formylglycine-generating enzyme family protein [Opitutaceae bacterium]|nr:formylglycine-generating enzyme family protein [Opitutaceae bacterium]